MKKSMPRIGMRIIKTSIAAFLILLIFTAVGAKRSPFYVLITTIICIQPDIANTKDTAFNRAIGTLIGAGHPVRWRCFWKCHSRVCPEANCGGIF